MTTRGTDADTAGIRVLCSNSSRAVMDELVPQFERASGHKVSVSYDPAKIMLSRIQGGETADLAILGAGDRKSTRLNSSHIQKSRMPSSA